MKKEFYHTAMKINIDTFNDIMPEEYFEKNENIVFRYDLMNFDKLHYFEKADVIYSEPPFPHGFKIFNERADIEDQRSYSDFAKSLSLSIKNINKPTFIICGKILLKKLPQAKNVFPIKLSVHNLDTFVAVWNYQVKFNISDTNDLIKNIAKEFNTIGDFCCGYGNNIFKFISHDQKKFIASDLNGKCVAIVKKRLKDYYDQKY
tara:strand:- start:694 stop:1305 length:612 start_codon:yes stop_codon:yes gene_type:complete